LAGEKLTGCPFAPRCKKATACCFEKFPPPANFGEGRLVYCYFPENTDRETLVL
jgi:ABC-type dipeptide/oligopeptide/nickel transport system ATPase component